MTQTPAAAAGPKQATFLVRLPPVLLAELRTASAATGESVSALIRSGARRELAVIRERGDRA